MASYFSLARCLALVVCLSAALADSAKTARPASVSAATLPIIYFHGITATAKTGLNLQQNLTTDSRPFVALNFCEGTCSVRALASQVPMAIEQIRSIVANDSRFANGYVFIGHSQGGLLARAVIEEMDDHKVHTFISLAGAQNGQFYGPQPSDAVPTQVFLKSLGPKVLPPTLMNFSSYTAEDVATGKPQVDFVNLVNTQPELQNQVSVVNLLRSPIRADWVRVNSFLPPVNNMEVPGKYNTLAQQLRRKTNFLKLKAAHFFASSGDDIISPWQSSIFGQYSEVSSLSKLKTNFKQLKVIPMKDTQEYKFDTYGLRTLDRRGGLHLHTIDAVSHNCWVFDHTPLGASTPCLFRPVFEQSVFPLLGASA